MAEHRTLVVIAGLDPGTRISTNHWNHCVFSRCVGYRVKLGHDEMTVPDRNEHCEPARITDRHIHTKQRLGCDLTLCGPISTTLTIER